MSILRGRAALRRGRGRDKARPSQIALRGSRVLQQPHMSDIDNARYAGLTFRHAPVTLWNVANLSVTASGKEALTTRQSAMSAMPATMAARARPLRRRFVSWKNFAPSRNVITTEKRRMSDPTEIGTPGIASPWK